MPMSPRASASAISAAVIADARSATPPSASGPRASSGRARWPRQQLAGSRTPRRRRGGGAELPSANSRTESRATAAPRSASDRTARCGPGRMRPLAGRHGQSLGGGKRPAGGRGGPGPVTAGAVDRLRPAPRRPRRSSDGEDATGSALGGRRPATFGDLLATPPSGGPRYHETLSRHLMTCCRRRRSTCSEALGPQRSYPVRYARPGRRR